MSEELMRIFAECTEAIEEEQLTIEGCLNKYPQYRTELADLLPLVVQTRAVPKAYPTPEFRQRAQARLLAQLPPRPITSNGAVSVKNLFRVTAVDHTLTRQLHTMRAKLARR